MSCLKPIAIKVKKTNPVTDKVTNSGMLTVPCGYCHKCRAKKRRDWSYRLEIEAENSTFGRHFVTLTYSDENLPFITEYGDIVHGIQNIKKYHDKNAQIQQCLVKRDVQLFIKRLRKKQTYYYEHTLGNVLVPKIRYFLAGEYGSKSGRPHYHILLFNALPKTVESIPRLWSYKGTNGEYVPRGMVHVGKITPSSIKYCCKYILKSQAQKNKYVVPEFQLMSRGSKKIKTGGIGYQFFTSEKARFNLTHNSLLVRNHNNKLQVMPKYYRDKLFPDSERKIIAYEKLQQEIKEVEIQEHDRIRKLGEDVGYYELDSIRAFIQSQDKSLLNTKF